MALRTALQGLRSRPCLPLSSPGVGTALLWGHPTDHGARTGLLSICFLICKGGTVPT